MRTDEKYALSILEKLGFKYKGRLNRPEVGTMNYDFEVEKNGAIYAVEVKVSEGKKFTVPWEELREMSWQFAVHSKNGLLVFIDVSCDEYCIFKLSHVKIGFIKKEAP